MASNQTEAFDAANAVSRIEQMKRAGIIPKMPPNPAPHITDRLIEMGLSEAAGMGTVPLSWQEINAWCARTCIDLPPWEARLMRRLSSDYVAESRRAESINAPAPWHTPGAVQERDAEEALLRSVLG